MIFQIENLSEGFLISLYIILVVALITFVLGVTITRWWAIKENWNEDFRPSIRLNLFWIVINLVVFITLIPVTYGFFIATLICFLVNIFVGAIFVSKFYEKRFKKSLIFVLFIIIVLFIIWFIVYLITTVIVVVIMIGLEL